MCILSTHTVHAAFFANELTLENPQVWPSIYMVTSDLYLMQNTEKTQTQTHTHTTAKTHTLNFYFALLDCN